MKGALAGLLATAALLLLAAPASAAVWVIPATARAFPTSPPGSSQSIAISAAGNEYEGVQVVVRGSDVREARLSWAEGSDPLIVATTTLSQVAYVRIAKPSTDAGGKAGDYPDPLLPRDFGAALTVPARTSAFYLLAHVPYGTKAGSYKATLTVENGAERVTIPFRLRVYGFGWKRLSTHTAFNLSQGAIKESLAGSGVAFSGARKERILTAYYTMLREHGVTPMAAPATPRLQWGGGIDEARYAADLAPWLSAEGLDLPDVQLPWYRYFPYSIPATPPDDGLLAAYLTGVCRVFKTNGWEEKAYAYILDETMTTSAERQAEAYARALHKASAAAGFRARFLLTDDPRPSSLGGIKAANRFLYDDVDIWCPRYYYFFGRVPALRERRAAGKEIWWYTYANTAADRLPGYLIDKTLADQRVWGWLMEQWDVDGLLNWGTNRWGDALTGQGFRDPYRDPLSYRKRPPDNRVANGDTCLIYPGYYPRYGLTDPYAPPVSSLRLEALRDGFEDREYLRLAARAPGGAAFAKQVSAQVTWFPYPIRQANVFTFPKYTTKAEVFARARGQLAERIEG